MTQLLASVFTGMAMLFGGIFNHHMGPNPEDMGSTTPEHHPMASTTPWGHDGEGTTTPWGRGGMGSTTPRMGEREGTSTPGHMMMAPVVAGVVTAVNGTSLTMNGRNFMSTATTTYSVDASSAKVIKANQGQGSTESVSDIKVGDRVMVMGTVSGTNITARTIVDGILPPHPHPMPQQGGQGGGEGMLAPNGTHE